MNIANLLLRAGRARAERPALVVGTDRVADYGALVRRVAAIAGGLGATFGLEPGSRVALVMRNCPAFVESLFACWHGGWVAVPINAKLHPREIAFILAHSGARVCFAGGDLAPRIAALRPELPDLRAVVTVEDADYAKLAAAEPAPIATRAPEDTAWLFYTSGTTGRPKGAMLSHRNLLAMTTSYFVDVDRIAEDACIIHAAPMSHGSGMYILPHVAAAAKQVVPTSGGFEPDEVFALIAAHPGASLFAAPTMVRRLVDSAAAGANTRNLKTIVYGGGPMYVEDCKRAMAVLGNKLAQIYGQGESPMTITALSKARHAETAHPRYEQRLASVGTAHTVVEVAVADADDRLLPPGELGEVLVHGDSVMSGYWGDPEASARTLRGGWLHTGDVGVFDADGFLTLKEPVQRPDHQRRQQHLSARGRGGAAAPPRRRRGRGDRRGGSRLGRDRRRLRRRCGGRPGRAVGDRCAVPRSPRPLQASETLCLHRLLAEEQLRQGAEDGAAGAARKGKGGGELNGRQARGQGRDRHRLRLGRAGLGQRQGDLGAVRARRGADLRRRPHPRGRGRDPSHHRRRGRRLPHAYRRRRRCRPGRRNRHRLPRCVRANRCPRQQRRHRPRRRPRRARRARLGRGDDGQREERLSDLPPGAPGHGTAGRGRHRQQCVDRRVGMVRRQLRSLRHDQGRHGLHDAQHRHPICA